MREQTKLVFNHTVSICSHWGCFLATGVRGAWLSQAGSGCSVRLWRAQASLALGPCCWISSSPMVLQLPDLTHGLSKAGHLGRPFLFRKIACDQGPMRASFCLFCFHLSWLLPTRPTQGGPAPWWYLHVLVYSKYIRRSLCLVRSPHSVALSWKKQQEIFYYPRASSLCPFYCSLFWVDNSNKTEKKRGAFLALGCHTTTVEY